ncbi:hypothetical protein G7046_g5883 [Stylonectria norvegica]|nr:hypothetical protein G7046_g5883 [Stylonectria norvegica]
MALHQYDYIFAIGTIFAFLDAWNIGANDVANSWATSVSSRSLSYVQAMALGSVLEFAGSVGVGARVADTIRTKVVDIDQFEDDPALLMLGMMCAVIASSVYLTCCTRIGLPVSTTHSIMGGVIGMGIALVGTDGIHWAEFSKGNISSGVVSVFLAWIIAPGLAGCFAAIIFMITKYGVMLRSNPVWKGLFLVPVYFGITASLLTMLIVWKGGSISISFTNAETAGMIVGVGAAWGLVVLIFLVPWMYRLVIKDDWPLRWYHIPLGPLLLRRPDPPAQPEGASGGITDFYEGHLTREELNDLRRAGRNGNGEFERADDSSEPKQLAQKDTPDVESETAEVKPRKSIVGPRPDGPWYKGDVLFWVFKFIFLKGIDQDIINMQKKEGILSGDLAEIHANVPHYDNRVEYLYTFLQVMTACTASFTHGANDVANAIGPYATIYQIWSSGDLAGSKSNVPIWILCFGGAGIVLGIWTYGYNIMRNLGNRLTLHSPSRGFSMELGSAVTIILATRLKLPVSTTQCITGATVGAEPDRQDFLSGAGSAQFPEQMKPSKPRILMMMICLPSEKFSDFDSEDLRPYGREESFEYSDFDPADLRPIEREDSFGYSDFDEDECKNLANGLTVSTGEPSLSSSKTTSGKDARPSTNVSDTTDTTDQETELQGVSVCEASAEESSLQNSKISSGKAVIQSPDTTSKFFFRQTDLQEASLGEASRSLGKPTSDEDETDNAFDENCGDASLEIDDEHTSGDDSSDDEDNIDEPTAADLQSADNEDGEFIAVDAEDEIDDFDTFAEVDEIEGSPDDDSKIGQKRHLGEGQGPRPKKISRGPSLPTVLAEESAEQWIAKVNASHPVDDSDEDLQRFQSGIRAIVGQLQALAN